LIDLMMTTDVNTVNRIFVISNKTNALERIEDEFGFFHRIHLISVELANVAQGSDERIWPKIVALLTIAGYEVTFMRLEQPPE
jgi:hypothetical protein